MKEMENDKLVERVEVDVKIGIEDSKYEKKVSGENVMKKGNGS